MINKLYGAILGDLAGQPYEFKYKGDYSEFNIHDEKSHFTDDTLMTLASAQYILDGANIESSYKDMGARYKGDYYGAGFKKWLASEEGTIGNSWGNGCLMRISPFMYVEDSLPEIIKSVQCSHNNTISFESVMKLYNYYKEGMGSFDGYTSIKPFKKFEVIADKTVNFCLNVCSKTFSTHQAIETAIKCGGDTDTNASIVGELSNYEQHDISKEDKEYVESKLDTYLLNILHRFNKRFTN